MKFCKSKGIKKIEHNQIKKAKKIQMRYTTLIHQILLKKLEYYDVAGKNLRWFENYLQDRKLKLQ